MSFRYIYVPQYLDLWSLPVAVYADREYENNLPEMFFPLIDRRIRRCNPTAYHFTKYRWVSLGDI